MLLINFFLTSSNFWFCLSISLLVLNFTRKNNNFFDIKSVFIQQFKLFKECKFQIVIFYIVPLFLAIGTVITRCIDKEIINNIIIVLSIFMSMFFAILSILNGYNNKGISFVKTLSETYNTIIFECILCIIVLIVSFIHLFMDNYKAGLALKLNSCVLYYLMFTIVLNIFVVIKRMKVLFENR